MTAAEVALKYARQGHAVFPAVPSGDARKRPYIKGWPENATNNQARVRQWWKRWPDALIGLPTGNGVVVIDVDPRHGGTIPAGLPATLTVMTPSGGWHLYYTCLTDVGCSVGRFAPGIDVRGRGGYVIAAGVGGWQVADDRAPVELPAWALELCIDGGPTGRDAGSRHAFRPQDRVSEGGRNDYLARYAGWALRSGLAGDGEQLCRALRAENDTTCDPPLDPGEVARIATSIATKHARENA